MSARTGQQYLADLKASKRRIYIENDLVSDVTDYPPFAGAATTLAALYDVQLKYPNDCLTADPENGEPMNVSHMVPRSKEDLRHRRRGIERTHTFTLGHMGRSPDYCNMGFAGFAAFPEYWSGTEGSNREGAYRLVEYQRMLRRRDLSLTHTLHYPSVDKSQEGQVVQAGQLRKVGETRTSIVVSGARILATLAPFSDEVWVGPGRPPLPKGADDCALFFCVPLDIPGLMILCRDSYSAPNASWFDRPLSARFDEQDALLIFDNVEVPKERVFLDGDVDLYNRGYGAGFQPNTKQQTVTRTLIKLEFAYALASQMADTLGDRSSATMDRLGEILSYVELTRNALYIAEEHAYDYGGGVFFPDDRAIDPLMGTMMTVWIPRAMEIVKLIGGHHLLVTPSEAMLANPDLRPHLERYLGTANEIGVEERTRLFRLAWDFVGSSLGGRQELYERNFIGSGNTNRLSQVAKARGLVRRNEPVSKPVVTSRSQALLALAGSSEPSDGAFTTDEILARKQE